jgi:CheY-like chemotaxis protein
VADAVPARVNGDPTRLRQILTNFLNNALKFTQAGQIQLTVRCDSTGDDGTATLRFEVSDSGIGIPPEVQERLFSRFTQADASTTRAYGGTGLGLAICKQLSHLMGGDIGVSSGANAGATFWVSLPFAPARAPAPAAPAPATPASGAAPAETQPWHLLLAEDNPINQMVAVGILGKLGYRHVVVANNGAEVLEKYAAGGFDLILMDCQMPVLDGYAATTELRAKGCQLPIVAMTANAVKGDRELCLAVGMNDYVSKPVSLPVMKATLERWLHGHAVEPGDAAAP